MPEPNPYGNPTFAVTPTAAQDAQELASRWARLGAALVDWLIVAVVFMPLVYFGKAVLPLVAARGDGPPPGALLFWFVVHVLVYVAIQGVPLHRYGQSWGKRLLKIRIVSLEGEKPELIELIVRRVLPLRLLGLIPWVGPWLILANVLLIFRADHRCLHDHIARTRVVTAG